MMDYLLINVFLEVEQTSQEVLNGQSSNAG